MPNGDETALPKLPKRDLTEEERRRKFQWTNGDIVVIKNPPQGRKSRRAAKLRRQTWN